MVPTEFQDLVGKMSNDQETKEEEIKSLIVATEAFRGSSDTYMHLA